MNDLLSENQGSIVNDIRWLDTSLRYGQLSVVSHLDHTRKPHAERDLKRALAFISTPFKRRVMRTGIWNIRKILPATWSRKRAKVVGKAHSNQGMRRACRPKRKTPSIEAHFKNNHVESKSSEAVYDS
jgi:hypothetical protein